MLYVLYLETLMPYSRLSVANSNEKMLGGEVMRGASNTLGGGMSGVMLNLNADSNISDDSFDIIQRLLAENCYLKSREIRDKLQKLKKEMPKFSKYHQEIKTLNHADKNLENLSGLASEMRNIHKKAKSKMVEAKIVDLETLKDLTIAEKNENMNKFLKDARKSMELIKSEAISYFFLINMIIILINLKKVSNSKPAKIIRQILMNMFSRHIWIVDYRSRKY